MNLIDYLSVVTENRSDINQKHHLIDVIFLVISAITSGCEGWQDIETYGDEKLHWLRQYRPFTHGIPRRHTIARILRSVVAESLLEALALWINDQREAQSKPVIAFDGKVLRGSYRNDRTQALQLVTAYDTERGLVLSQKPTKNKRDEISTVKQLIDIINVKGGIITLDALHCQQETLEKIAEKKAHIVVQVKKNQPGLYDAVASRFQAVFDAGKEQVVTETVQEQHGRKEERYVFQLKANLSDDLKEKWPTVRSFIAVERHRVIKGKGSVETSYYVSSLSPKNRLIGHYIRQHWRIENSQHYVLDIVFKEDNSRISLDGAIENMALFRRFVLNMLKQCDCGAPSQKVKLKKSAWSDDYRTRIFFG